MTKENDKPPAVPAGPFTPEQHAAWTEARQRRKSQVGLYYGIGPEPVPGDGRYWEGWIEDLYMIYDWSKVPVDWQPGAPRDPETQASLDREAIRQADAALARIIESSRGGRST
jgi:hypothetical protein